MPRQNPEMTPALIADMEQLVAEGVRAYIVTYTRELFPDHTQPAAMDCILAGIAQALRCFERDAGCGRPLCQTLAYNLLDTQQEQPK